MRRHLALWCLAAGILSMAASDAPLAQSVGSAAAVKPEATGTPPGGGLRTMRIGTEVLSNELISTGATGSMQIMFLDMTTLTVGPNSDLIIDRFVFDPNQSTGEFTARLTKGALRFVGGAISHNNVATIATPTATIGIRGGGAYVQFLQRCEKKPKPGSSLTNAPQKPCTRVACTVGTCSVSSLDKSFSDLQLRVNEVVDIGDLGLERVTLEPTATQAFASGIIANNSEGEDEEGNLPATEDGPTGGDGAPLNVQAQAEQATEFGVLLAPPPPGGIGAP